MTLNGVSSHVLKLIFSLVTKTYFFPGVFQQCFFFFFNIFRVSLLDKWVVGVVRTYTSEKKIPSAYSKLDRERVEWTWELFLRSDSSVFQIEPLTTECSFSSSAGSLFFTFGVCVWGGDLFPRIAVSFSFSIT